MKDLVLENLILEDFNVCSFNYDKWGPQQKHSIKYISYKKSYIVIDAYEIEINLKKIISISQYIAKKNGIGLGFFRRSKILKKDLFDKIPNYYIAFMNKLQGLITNIKYFGKNLLRFKEHTNYKCLRIPSLIIMSTKCWQSDNKFLTTLIKYRVIFIKCGSFIENDIHLCYNIVIGNSKRIYNTIKTIFIIQNIIKKSIW